MSTSRLLTLASVAQTCTPCVRVGNLQITLAALGEIYARKHDDIAVLSNHSHEIVGYAVKVGDKVEGGIK